VSGPSTAREQLPEALRRAVDQTVAAERLEGWCPTGAHVDALAALLCDEMCFDDYLADAEALHLPDTTPSRRDHWRALRRRQPYLIPGTTLLRNNFGVTHHQALAELEFVATAGRIALWHRRSAHSGLVGHAEYNQIHPFREGNGRTGTLLLHTVAALCGHRLDLTGVTREEWYSASRDSMPFRRGSGADGVNPRPFVPLLLRALR